MAVKTLKVGDKGKEVKALQEMLNDAKLGTKVKTNGEFDEDTEEALKEFQSKKRVKADGVADEKFFDAIADITEIQITDDLGNTMVVRVRTGWFVSDTWERVSGSLPGISARSGSVETNVPGRLVLDGLCDCRNYRRRVGASGEGVSASTSGSGVIQWEVLSVK